MHKKAWLLLALNILGGAAVLGSYAYGISSNPKLTPAVWGGVPESLKPLYTISMFTAAAGFFPFTLYILFKLPQDALLGDRPAHRIFLALYAIVLIPSAMWMPMTFQMLKTPNISLWWGIRIVLFAVGAGSLGILYLLWRLKPPQRSLFHSSALLGAAAFCFQTAILDAIIWPAYFPT